jgi:hypothetical protein
MQKLESLLTERETAIAVDFDHLKHCVRCYAHIINICSSHVISSMTSVSKPYISKLKVPVDSNFIFCGDSEDELDDDDDDDDILAAILMTWNWIATMTRVNLILNTGLQVSSVIPSGVLAGLFVYCALWTYAGRTFVYLSKTETHESGSMKGPRVANAIQSKFPSYSF